MTRAVAPAAAVVVQTQIRCTACNRRLADLVNEVEAGQVIVEMKNEVPPMWKPTPGDRPVPRFLRPTEAMKPRLREVPGSGGDVSR
jgi:hypothetical protein